MPTVTLRPNGDVVTGWTTYPAGGNHYEKVDEETPDEDSTYIYTDGLSLADLFDLTDSGLSGVTINSVTVYFRGRRTTSNTTKCRIRIRTYGSTYQGTLETLTDDYEDYPTEWTTNPYTGEAWTIEEVDDLIAGVFSTNVLQMKRVTAVWVVVDYISGGQIYEINVDAVVKASVSHAEQCTFNIEKDAAVTSEAAKAPETTFNVLKDAITQASADVLVEIISGIIEIFKDALVQAQATITLESTFNIEKDTIATTDAFVDIETIFNVVKDTIAQVSATPQILGIYPINVDATVQASTIMQLQQTLGISKDAIVVAVSTPAIQSTFNISKDVVVKVLAEVSVVKEGEAKVTKIFLMIGNLAIQLTGD